MSPKLGTHLAASIVSEEWGGPSLSLISLLDDDAAHAHSHSILSHSHTNLTHEISTIPCLRYPPNTPSLKTTVQRYLFNRSTWKPRDPRKVMIIWGLSVSRPPRVKIMAASKEGIGFDLNAVQFQWCIEGNIRSISAIAKAVFTCRGPLFLSPRSSFDLAFIFRAKKV